MQEDNLYPNHGDYFGRQPIEQERDDKKEAKAYTDQRDIIAEFITRLDKQVEHYKSTDAIPAEVLTDPNEFMHVVAANKIVAEVFKLELNRFETLRDQMEKELHSPR